MTATNSMLRAMKRQQEFMAELHNAAAERPGTVDLLSVGAGKAKAIGAWIDVHHVRTFAAEHWGPIHMSEETHPGSNTYFLAG